MECNDTNRDIIFRDNNHVSHPKHHPSQHPLSDQLSLV